MADSLEKQAVNGAAAEGRLAALQDRAADVCPYGDIGGLIGKQLVAWQDAWKAARNG